MSFTVSSLSREMHSTDLQTSMIFHSKLAMRICWEMRVQEIFAHI